MSSLPDVKQGHIATLDLLRLVAALAVVAFHYLFRGAAGEGYLSQGYPAAAPFAIYGYLGVNLFFLISGFVIAWSAQGRNWESFAVARFARLYPGFVTSMTITFLVMTLAASPLFPVSLKQYAANFLMFAPAFGQEFMDGAYWSIVLEIIFYGWVTVAIFCGAFDRFRLELVAFWLALSVLNEFALGSGALRLLFVTEYAPLFAAGMLVQHIHSAGRSPQALMLLAAAFVVSSANMTIAQAWMQEHYAISIGLPNLLAANLAMHAMLIAAVRFRHMVSASPLVLALGGVTYPLYLLHQHIGYVAINALAPNTGKWLAAALVLGAVLGLSYLIWRFIETPLRRTMVMLLMPLLARLQWIRGGERLRQTPA
jgi:peptidoglycan/LPS O-acetylase OafA/YrhL